MTKDQLIKYLEDQIAVIGNFQKELRDFKHGQAELLVAINASIESGDKQLMRKLLDQYNIRVKEIFELEPKFPFVSNLTGTLMPVRHLILAKANLSQMHGVSLTAEIPVEISDIPLPLLDFIDILGVWLNNAIEEAILTEEKTVHVSFIVDENLGGSPVLELRVSNSFRPKSIHCLDVLYQQGVSTKGDNRGKGLAIVREKLMMHDNIHIKTQILNNKFIQLLEIE